MEVLDLAGRTEVACAVDLEERLRSARKGSDGAFVLSHERDGPSLWLHLNGGVAYLHYFPNNEGKHPGYQATGMSPPDCAQEVRFKIVGGFEGDAIIMPRGTLVPTAVAFQAAKEFLHNAALPKSVSWIEL